MLPCDVTNQVQVRPDPAFTAYPAPAGCSLAHLLDLEGLDEAQTVDLIKKAWASGLSTSPVRKMMRDNRWGYARSSSR